MSEVEGSDPTAGRDAPVVETIKTNNMGNAVLQSECASGCNDDATMRTSGNVTATAKETEAPTEINRLEKNSGKNMLEEATSPNICAAQSKIVDTTAEIVNLITEDASAVRVDTQTPAAKIDGSTVTVLQARESPNEEKADNKSMEDLRDNNATSVSRLEEELRVRESLEDTDCSETDESSSHELDNAKRTKERDVYRKHLEETKTKLTALQASYDVLTSSSDENTSRQSVEQLHGQLAQTALMYEERNRVIANQENQINALNTQVASLKEVVSITRDLLQIRNMEVKQLQAEVDNMEKKISEERDRHNAMINKMDTAMRLNADLKKEYETQLSLFQSLREKYGEKITLLTGEKQVLDMTATTSK